jgi:uncharacterized protein (DUF433 family)
MMRGFVLRRLAPHAGLIAQRYETGESFADIAEHFGCGWSTIRRFLLSQEVPLRQEPRRRKLDDVHGEVVEAFRAGHDVEDIASRFRVQPQTVRNFLFERAGLVAAGSDDRLTGPPAEEQFRPDQANL